MHKFLVGSRFLEDIGGELGSEHRFLNRFLKTAVTELVENKKIRVPSPVFMIFLNGGMSVGWVEAWGPTRGCHGIEVARGRWGWQIQKSQNTYSNTNVPKHILLQSNTRMFQKHILL